MLPFYVVILDAVTKVGYMRLLGGLAGPSYAATIELCATVHRLKFALIDIRNYATLALVLIAAISLLRSRTSQAVRTRRTTRPRALWWMLRRRRTRSLRSRV